MATIFKKLKFWLIIMGSIIPNTYAQCMDTNKTIFITTDDGPLKGTENFIKVFTEEKIPATMFMVGLHYENSSNKIKEMIEATKKADYIQIANHSYSHGYNHYKHFYADLNNVIADLKKNNQTLGLSGSPIYTRLPGRDVFRIPGLFRDDIYASKTEERIEELDDKGIYENGFNLYGWDLEWVHDSHGKPMQSVEELVQQIDESFIKGKTACPNKLILLAHDEMFQDRFNGSEKLKQLIVSLRQKNYKFDVIKNYKP
jgi:peptidoglycan/xylan/chitin deacetylase (PgdA/CDA1 family)